MLRVASRPDLCLGSDPLIFLGPVPNTCTRIFQTFAYVTSANTLLVKASHITELKVKKLKSIVCLS